MLLTAVFPTLTSARCRELMFLLCRIFCVCEIIRCMCDFCSCVMFVHVYKAGVCGLNLVLKASAYVFTFFSTHLQMSP